MKISDCRIQIAEFVLPLKTWLGMERPDEQVSAGSVEDHVGPAALGWAGERSSPWFLVAELSLAQPDSRGVRPYVVMTVVLSAI